MADMMAIVSKAVFEKVAGKAPKVGTQLKMDRYVSANKNLERLGEGGKLYLVTVRPPDEALWLVAILEDPEHDGEQWLAKPCTTPIVDISKLKSKLKFDSGKGLPTTKGTLGMSLQTPRGVTAGDVTLLDAAAGAKGAVLAAGKAARIEDELAEMKKRMASPGKPAAGKPAAATRVVEGFPAAPAGVLSTGAGNRRELLLQAVIADPDNTGARQVYADALVAANDPRGEFIMLDTALDGPLAIRKRELMKDRRDALLKQHGKTWFPYKAIAARTHHGFVAAASGTLKDLTKDAAVFAVEPVAEVEVLGMTEDTIDKLLAATWLPRIHKLVVRGELGDEAFAALVASPALANVRALNVSGTEVTGEGLAALQGNLASCRMLVLTNNQLGDEGVAGLVKWAHLGTVETLYISNCDLTAKGVDQLLGGPPLAKLAKLALTKNELGNAVAASFVKRADKLPALQHLELRESGIGAAGVTKLLEASLPALKKLDVRDNGVKKIADPRVTA